MHAYEGNDFDPAIASYGDIAEGSVYREKGAAVYATAKRSFLAAHLDAALRARERHKCDEARQHVEAALTVDEGNPQALDILRKCGAPVPVKPHLPKTVAVKEPVKEPVKRNLKDPFEEPVKEEATGESPIKSTAEQQPTSELSSDEANVISAKAMDAYVGGRYADAIDLSRKTLKAQPTKSWRIIGAASCFLKDRATAVTAWNRLPNIDRQFLKYVCARNSIDLP